MAADKGLKKVNNLDQLNHVLRNKILLIEAALLDMRKAIISYEDREEFDNAIKEMDEESYEPGKRG